MKRFDIVTNQQTPAALLLIALLSHLPVSFYVAAVAAAPATEETLASNDADTSIKPQPQDARDGRIVGGFETSIVIFPHQLSLQFYELHICGAALITSQFALTAAHCVAQYHHQPHLYTIRAGSTEHARGGVVVHVKRIIPHALFHKPTLMNNDIALVQLTNPLAFNASIRPIAMMSATMGHDGMPSKQQHLEYSEELLFVSGWGTVFAGELVRSPRLRYTVVQPQNQAKCELAYAKAGINITESMLCAGTTRGGRDSCQGDSGGPLITYVDGGRSKLIGIVSFGFGCANAAYPGIYTRVAAYEQWIRQTMQTV